MGQQPKKNWFVRHKILTAILVLVVVGIIGAAIGDDETESNVASSVPSSTSSTAMSESDTSSPTTEPVAQSEAPSETVTTQTNGSASEELSDGEGDLPLSRDSSSAVATTLGAGTFYVGTDLQPGRYVITPGSGQTGNLYARTDRDPLAINEILGVAMGLGVPSVTADLIDGERIQISGLSKVVFTPAETTLRTTLSTGDWIAGLDIEPGRYIATPEGKGMGNFVVYNGGLFPKVNEILDSSAEFGVPNVTLELERGDVIRISGIAEVKFTIK